MISYLCEIDWPTLLAFAITVLTIVCTTIVTIKHQKRALDSQIFVSRDASERDKEKSRIEFIANSRQLWINSLRDEVASFIAETSSIWDLFQQKSGRAEVLALMNAPEYAMSELANWSTAYGSAVTRAERSRAKIQLLLNPTEPASTALMNAIDAAYRTAKSKDDPEQKNSKVISALQPILKSEWKRVKAQDGA
ncbi:hypothetical protein [Pusillimonas minor]|uniref:DUF4760 domain-containing protein n=1 Tax=Pusillimonas minor TaxID=2697024 RepID=A0A842HS43_9BURK|nr:hypothetical protein [Pusillimonas minor]MBC2771063.1 hypothetical protein [Pusillimonas minor]